MAYTDAYYPPLNKISIAGKKICFMRFVPQNRVQVLDHTNQLMCGTLEDAATDVTPGLRLYGYEVWIQPTVEELIHLLPYIGFTQDGSYFSVKQYGDLTSFETIAHSQVQNEVYADCKVTKATFTSQAGGALILSLQVIAKTMTTNTDPFTATGVADNTRPWIMSQATAILNSLTVGFRQFTYAIDWNVQRAINNSETADDLDAVDLQQYVVLNMPYNPDRVSILNLALGSDRDDGIAGSVTFSRTLAQAQQIVFTFDNLKRPEANTPSWLGKKAEMRDAAVYKVFANVIPSTIITVANGSISTTTTSTTTTGA